VSETKIAVRTTSEGQQFVGDQLKTVAGSGGAARLMGGAGQRATSQDAFVVADYVRSANLIEHVGGKALMQALYSSPQKVDWFGRLDRSWPIETVHDYWKQKVRVTVDTISSILTIQVRAYTPSDAQLLTRLILERSEQLVNELTDRARRDALSRADVEMAAARKRLRQARQALLTFRNENASIDPKLSATAIGETITQLMRERIGLESNRDSTSEAANSPTRRVVTAQIEAINKQIEALRNEVASTAESGTLSAQIASYDDLLLETQFAEKLYAIGLQAYENARNDLDRQMIYIATIVKPTLPERASYPRVLVDTSLVFMASIIAWGMGMLLIASVNDHMG
jgi:capsular polysaccharide transport system permease protein